MADIDVKLAICREISGFGDVSERFAASAFERLTERHGAPAVDTMTDIYGDSGCAVLFSAAAGPSAAIAKDLLGYLYSGSFPNEEAIAEDYFESLMWRAALAHPPAVSGGYFGHWRYPPEDCEDA